MKPIISYEKVSTNNFPPHHISTKMGKYFEQTQQRRKSTGIVMIQELRGKMLSISGKIIIFAGMYLLFVSIFSRNIADNDLWGYLAFGRTFREEGFFPFHDIFSYTPTKTLWVYHEWLTGVVFYYVFEFLGPAGLQLLRYITIIVTLCLIYATAIKKEASPVFALIALIPAMILISFGYMPTRAQIFTYFFFILTVYILETAKINQRWKILLWLLPVQVIWCNLHGGFVAGIGMIFLYALGEGLSGKKAFPFIAILIPACLATLINPYGLEYWRFMADSVSMSRPEIGEWFSIIVALQRNYQTVPAIVFIALASMFLILILLQKKRSLTDMIIIAATLYLGVKHVRHTIFLGIIFGAIMPVIMNDLWKSFPEKNSFFIYLKSFAPPLILGIILIFAGFFIIKSGKIYLKPSFAIFAPQSHYPVGAIHWIERNNFRGNILPDFDWGEFIIWSCYPHCKIGMDGRYETVYDKTLIREYFDFSAGKDGWDVFLKKYPPDLVLIKPFTRIYYLLLKNPSWKVGYQDKQSVLFIRNNPS